MKNTSANTNQEFTGVIKIILEKVDLFEFLHHFHNQININTV